MAASNNSPPLSFNDDLFAHAVVMQIAPIVPDIFLVVTNVTLIVLYFLHISVAVRAIMPKIFLVVMSIGPILGKFSSIAGALVMRDFRAIAIQIPAVVIDIFLVVPDFTHISVSVASVPA